jgi:hypothetical protein
MSTNTLHPSLIHSHPSNQTNIFKYRYSPLVNPLSTKPHVLCQLFFPPNQLSHLDQFNNWSFQSKVCANNNFFRLNPLNHTFSYTNESIDSQVEAQRCLDLSFKAIFKAIICLTTFGVIFRVSKQCINWLARSTNTHPSM